MDGNIKSAWAIGATVALTAAASGQGADAAAARTKFELPAMPISIMEAGPRLVLGLGLNGVAFADPGKSPDEPGALRVVKELPTLAALEVAPDTLLLAGRDGTLRLIRQEGPTSEPKTVFEVPAEGIPTGLAYRSPVLAVAGGGAGLSLWNWNGIESPPQLVGRYPFVAYAKEAVFFDATTLLVTDSHTAGLWVVDVSDPTRPRKREHLQALSFADAVDAAPPLAAYTDRAYGTWIVSRGESVNEMFRLVQRIYLMPSAQMATQSQNVRFQNGELLVVETSSGVREWRPDAQGTWKMTGQLGAGEGAIDALIMRDGRLAYVTEKKTLVVTTLGKK